MDKINKNLLKLSSKQRLKLLTILAKVQSGNLAGIAMKKLKGHANLYRIRVGGTRLILQKLPDGTYSVIYVGKRDDQTYRDF